MPRYIDADSLLKELNEELNDNFGFNSEDQRNYFRYGLRYAVRAIERQPTSDGDELERSFRDAFEEGQKYIRIAEQNIQKVKELKIELEAMRGAANSYKMHYEGLAREIFAEIEKEIVAALESNYKFIKDHNSFSNSASESLMQRVYGKTDTLRGIEGFIEELKEKYTKGDAGE